MNSRACRITEGAIHASAAVTAASRRSTAAPITVIARGTRLR